MVLKFEKQAALILLLRISAICVFLGRAWQYIRWDAPYREILWNEKIMQPILNLFGVTWEQWSNLSDPGITLFIQISGFFFILCAWSALRITQKNSWHYLVIIAGTLQLMLLTYLSYLHRLAALPIILEYTLQWSTPLFLIWFLKKNSKTTLVSMKLAIALTFTGHGIYAAGIYAVPGDFVRLLQGATFITSYETAIQALLIFGVIDFIISVGIFIPKIDLFFLGYAAIWGTLTALARMVSFMDSSRFWLSISEWLHQTIYRFPHGIVPLICLLMVLSKLKSTALKKRSADN